MLKMKIFKSPDNEKSINKWLSDNPNIEVKQVCQSECVNDIGQRRVHNVTISLWYEENKKKVKKKDGN